MIRNAIQFVHRFTITISLLVFLGILCSTLATKNKIGMVKEEEDIKWTHIERVKDAHHKIRWRVSRLPDDAVYIENFTKMRVNLKDNVIGLTELDIIMIFQSHFNKANVEE